MIVNFRQYATGKNTGNSLDKRVAVPADFYSPSST